MLAAGWVSLNAPGVVAYLSGGAATNEIMIPMTSIMAVLGTSVK